MRYVVVVVLWCVIELLVISPLRVVHGIESIND
jgi:hypothetical protein